MCAEKAETPGGWTGIGRSVCDFAPYVNPRRRGTPKTEGDAGQARRISRGAVLDNIGRGDLEAQSLQDLDGVVSGAIQENAAIGEASVLPLAPLPTIGEQTILERAFEKQLALKAYRLLTVSLILYLFPGLSRLPWYGPGNSPTDPIRKAIRENKYS